MPKLTIYLSDDVYDMLRWWASVRNLNPSRIVSEVLRERITPEVINSLTQQSDTEDSEGGTRTFYL